MQRLLCSSALMLPLSMQGSSSLSSLVHLLVAATAAITTSLPPVLLLLPATSSTGTAGVLPNPAQDPTTPRKASSCSDWQQGPPGTPTAATAAAVMPRAAGKAIQPARTHTDAKEASTATLTPKHAGARVVASTAGAAAADGGGGGAAAATPLKTPSRKKFATPLRAAAPSEGGCGSSTPAVVTVSMRLWQLGLDLLVLLMGQHGQPPGQQRGLQGWSGSRTAQGSGAGAADGRSQHMILDMMEGLPLAGRC